MLDVWWWNGMIFLFVLAKCSKFKLTELALGLIDCVILVCSTSWIQLLGTLIIHFSVYGEGCRRVGFARFPNGCLNLTCINLSSFISRRSHFHGSLRLAGEDYWGWRIARSNIRFGLINSSESLCRLHILHSFWFKKYSRH